MNDTEQLKKSKFKGPIGPVVLAIMDGIGIGKYEEGDAVRSALKVNMDWLEKNALYTQLKAHGTAVGLPRNEDMGNSEVGHNAIGCGRVYDQGAKLVNQAISSGCMFKERAWRMLIKNCLERKSALHFIGLFSDGNVHSHLDHLKAMLSQAAREGVRRARVHILLDGRDVGETTALDYVERFEKFLAELNYGKDADFRIASGGGRMRITMDRYNADWNMVRLGWDTHVRGAGRQFASARQAIETFRSENPGVIDQDLPPFVIAANGRPIGPIKDNDSVIFFNFRGDRAIEISYAFEDDNFSAFDRVPRPKVLYAGMMQYDGDLKIPKNFLVSPPAIDRTLGQLLCRSGIKQLAVSETQKFGHVTYFFNGNRSGKFDEGLEKYVEIPSDIVPFEQRPWMKCAEITDYVVKAIMQNSSRSAPNKFRFIRLNYPNGDMVGHTGVYQATEIAVASVDLCVGRLIKAVRAAEGILVLSADHGNADDMYEHDEKTLKVKVDHETGRIKVKTSHSLNPVPAYIFDPAAPGRIRLSDQNELGISSLAATCLELLGFERPADYDKSIIEIK